MPEPKPISQLLRDAIMKANRSLEDIARSADLDKGQLSRFVRGERDLVGKNIDKLCREFGLTLVSTTKRKRR